MRNGDVIMDKKSEKSSIAMFIPVLAAIICGICSVSYIIYRTMSNKSYKEKWQDYDECGI